MGAGGESARSGPGRYVPSAAVADHPLSQSALGFPLLHQAKSAEPGEKAYGGRARVGFRQVFHKVNRLCGILVRLDETMGRAVGVRRKINLNFLSVVTYDVVSGRYRFRKLLLVSALAFSMTTFVHNFPGNIP